MKKESPGYKRPSRAQPKMTGMTEPPPFNPNQMEAISYLAQGGITITTISLATGISVSSINPNKKGAWKAEIERLEAEYFEEEERTRKQKRRWRRDHLEDTIAGLAPHIKKAVSAGKIDKNKLGVFNELIKSHRAECGEDTQNLDITSGGKPIVTVYLPHNDRDELAGG